MIGGWVRLLGFLGRLGGLLERVKDLKVNYNAEIGYLSVTCREFELTFQANSPELRSFIAALVDLIEMYRREKHA